MKAVIVEDEENIRRALKDIIVLKKLNDFIDIVGEAVHHAANAFFGGVF